MNTSQTITKQDIDHRTIRARQLRSQEMARLARAAWSNIIGLARKTASLPAQPRTA